MTAVAGIRAVRVALIPVTSGSFDHFTAFCDRNYRIGKAIGQFQAFRTFSSLPLKTLIALLSKGELSPFSGVAVS
jgi:hypothetical protein